jgi:hypothetical protein
VAIWRSRNLSTGRLTTDGRAVPVHSEWVGDVEVVGASKPADWLSDRLADPWSGGFIPVSAIVPSGFDAYLRVEHALHDDAVTDARQGTLPQDVAEALVRILAVHTSTPAECWMAVWNGWGGMPAAPAVVRHPDRDYVLLSAAVPMAARPLWSIDAEAWDYQSASLWWPEDRAWVVATEVDFRWTYVGGREAVVDALRRDPWLSTRQAVLDDVANV